MPPTADAQYDDLKRKARRRLVGAVVLALAAAVFVPMLLESDERPLGDDVSVRIPPVDQGKFVNRLNAPAGTPAASRPAPARPDAGAAASPADAASPSPSAPAPATDGAVPAPEAGKPANAPPAAAPPRAQPDAAHADAGHADASAPPAKSPAPAKSAAAPAKAAPDPAAKAAPAKSAGFVVQLAAFSDDKGANALANRLRKSGHPAFTEPVTTSRGTLWRVRVGPYATRDEANNARDKLKREGQNGIVAARAP